MDAYSLTWILIALLFLGLKAVVLLRGGLSSLRRLGWWRLLGFVFLWPGMKLQPFEPADNSAAPSESPRRLVLGGLLNLAVGALFLWGITRLDFVQRHILVYAAIGAAGLGLMLLFGAFDLLAAFWRWRGVYVDKLWQFPLASRTLAEYWGRRWNRAFHDFARDYVFMPLYRRLGSTGALLTSFLFSGVLHDLAISLPARGGYGLPTLYFCLQALGIWIERRWLAHRSQWVRRLWTASVVLAPIGLLFHRAFIENVLLPQFEALGAGRAGT